METAFANSIVVDRKRNLAFGELHSGKLQQLVHKFENHNKKLPTWPPKDCVEEFQKHQLHKPLFLDEVELLDLDIIGFSDNETWLYVSPKANQLITQNTKTPLQWCRQVLDAPEWTQARRSICLQLDSASCRRRLLSSPRATSTPPTVSRIAIVSPNGTPKSSTNRSNLILSDMDSKNSQSPIGRPRTPTFIAHLTCDSRLQYCSPRPHLDCDVIAPTVDEDDNLVPHGYKLQDLTDVQVVARLQEEKLRQDYASTSYALANRRSLSVTLPLSAPRDQEVEEKGVDEDSAHVSNHCLCPLPHAHTFSSAQDWRNNNILSMHPFTPPYPYAGPTQRPFKPRPDKLQRSLPNLAQSNSVPSASLLRNSQSFDSPGCSPLPQSSMASPNLRHTRVQSMGNLSSPSRQPLKATVFVSPTIRDSTCVFRSWLHVGSSRIPMLSKCSSHSALSPSPPLPAYFNDTAGTIPSCKLAKPGHRYKSMLRCFSS
ncbi:SLAIN motif-containing protein 1-like isoform X2 [Corythoichthys intestinalis]|uniref:SLAIN motif-containing protein 1-like isoform X2 n=1 Tax=Corythoichthys intestinalis TaxID=161448 RepID=UPI0025A517E7|nr:SLAIN motif-containing protein 1-like isoform X2 [Corythoichthys intestinalis]XP_061802685.1 SLAIN motif-containing protein 1-like [Nerophis lumbriciformis]